MCGRYASSANPDELIEEFEIDEVDDDLPPASYNVAPTDRVPVVAERHREHGTVRKLAAFRWGLVPSWAKDASIGARMINARYETVAHKPAFRAAFARRRCLIPADGYYEWYTAPQPEQESLLVDQAHGGKQPTKRGKPAKQPFFIHRGDSRTLVMAGLYEFWRDPRVEDPDQAWVRSCTIITTSATDALGQIHDRMPMVISPDAWSDWLDPTLTDADAAHDLLSVTDADKLQAYAVGKAVGNVANNGPELSEPLAETP